MEVAIDINAMDKFISSLSKSLQTLCHGCMEFDKGIEMVGYININIDSENSVDCVLNEKVRKSSKSNSMTFTSNSFLARKERSKVTRDASCSPLPELPRRLQPETRFDTGEDSLSFCMKKRHSFEIANAMSPRKRHRRAHASTHNFMRQGIPHEVVSDISFENSYCEPYFSHKMPEIKQEVIHDDNQCIDLSSHAAKKDVSESALGARNSSHEEESNVVFSNEKVLSSSHSSSCKPHESGQDQALSQFSSSKHAAPSNMSQHIQITEHEKSQASKSLNGNCHQIADPSESLVEEPSYLDEHVDEGSNDADNFEVIELGDDDDAEVQGLFTQSGQHAGGPYHSGFVWNNGRPYYESSSVYAHMWRERKKQASRIYRLNMTHEQRERTRWLARMRQRRRRAKLRQQVPMGSDTEGMRVEDC